MDAPIGCSQHRCSTWVIDEGLATEEPAGVALDMTFAATAGVAGGMAEVTPQAACAEPAIMRAVRGTLDRDCGIAAVSRPAEDGHQSRQARRDRSPGAVAKTRNSGGGTPIPSPIVAWIALRGGYTG
jgi:hypothetical protein